MRQNILIKCIGLFLVPLLLSPVFVSLVSAEQVAVEDAEVGVMQKVATGLRFPAAVTFTPDGRLLFNELTTGMIRVIKDGDLQTLPYATVEDVNAFLMLGLAVHPDFGNSPFVYLYHVYQDDDGALFNRVVRFTDNVDMEGSTGVDMQVIIDGIPAGITHQGGIILFGPDGKLYLSTGDADVPELAQDLTSLAGKILRINPDGSIPDDNPFPGSPIFSYGLRNVFGLDFHPVTGVLYATENGPDIKDEINIIVPGGNYGWPIVKGKTDDARFINPIKVYRDTIGPTNMVFYEGDRYCGQENNLFFGDFNNKALRKIVLKSPEFNQVLSAGIVRTFKNPVIDVELGPDGFIYVSTTTRIVRIVQALGQPC